MSHVMLFYMFYILSIGIIHTFGSPLHVSSPGSGYLDFAKRPERSAKKPGHADLDLITTVSPFDDNDPMSVTDMALTIMKDALSSVRKRPGAIPSLSSSMSSEFSSVKKWPGAGPVPDKLSSVKKRPGAIPALPSMPDEISSVRKRPGVQPDPDEFGTESVMSMSIDSGNDKSSHMLPDQNAYGVSFPDDDQSKSINIADDGDATEDTEYRTTNNPMKSLTLSTNSGIQFVGHQKDISQSNNIHQEPLGRKGMGNVTRPINKLPSTVPPPVTNLPISKPQNVTSHLPEQLMGVDINKGTVMRMLVVLIGSTFIVVLYFGIKAIRLRRNSRVQKYGLLSNRSSGNDYELSPLDFDDDEEDDDDQHTLFSKNMSN